LVVLNFVAVLKIHSFAFNRSSRDSMVKRKYF